MHSMTVSNKSSLMNSLPWIWWGIALVAFGLDQVTKYMAQLWLAEGDIHVVTSFFHYQLRFNEGAAFSFLADQGGWQRWFFTVIATVFSVVITVWIYRTFRANRVWELMGLSLILGGALGNLFDRALFGHVVDFIVWHYQEHQWPAFNIADAAICAGAICLIVDAIKGNKKDDA